MSGDSQKSVEFYTRPLSQTCFVRDFGPHDTRSAVGSEACNGYVPVSVIDAPNWALDMFADKLLVHPLATDSGWYGPKIDGGGVNVGTGWGVLYVKEWIWGGVKHVSASGVVKREGVVLDYAESRKALVALIQLIGVLNSIAMLPAAA